MASQYVTYPANVSTPKAQTTRPPPVDVRLDLLNAVRLLLTTNYHDPAHDFTDQQRIMKGNIVSHPHRSELPGEPSSNTVPSNWVSSRSIHNLMTATTKPDEQGILPLITSNVGKKEGQVQNGGTYGDEPSDQEAEQPAEQPAQQPVQRGGLINDAQIQALEIANRLKYGAGTIRDAINKLWINIQGRTAPAQCASLDTFRVYLDQDMLDKSKSGMFWPGYIMINDTIISPLDIVELEPNAAAAAVAKSVGEMYELIISRGKYQGYRLFVSITTGAPGLQQSNIVIYGPNGQSIADLERASNFPECFGEGITQPIVDKAMNTALGLSGGAGQLTPADRNTAFYILSVDSALLEMALLQISIADREYSEYAAILPELMTVLSDRLYLVMRLEQINGARLQLDQYLTQRVADFFTMAGGGEADEARERSESFKKDKTMTPGQRTHQRSVQVSEERKKLREEKWLTRRMTPKNPEQDHYKGVC